MSFFFLRDFHQTLFCKCHTKKILNIVVTVNGVKLLRVEISSPSLEHSIT